MKIRALNGKVFVAATYEDMADYLWHSQFIPPPTLEAWMEGSAERAKMWNGAVIRTDSVKNHIDDLIANEIYEKLED